MAPLASFFTFRVELCQIQHLGILTPGGSPKKVGAFGNTRARAFLNAPTDVFPVFLEQLARSGTHQLMRSQTHQLVRSPTRKLFQKNWECISWCVQERRSSCVPERTNFFGRASWGRLGRDGSPPLIFSQGQGTKIFTKAKM